MEKDKGAAAAADAERAAAEKQFAQLKTHYDAGLAAITEIKADQAQLAATPKDQQGPIQKARKKLPSGAWAARKPGCAATCGSASSACLSSFFMEASALEVRSPLRS